MHTRPLSPSRLTAPTSDGVERGCLLSLLSDKQMTPGKVMYFLKVTQVVGNRFFSWTLEVIWYAQKGHGLGTGQDLCPHATSATFAWVYASVRWGLNFLSQGF